MPFADPYSPVSGLGFQEPHKARSPMPRGLCTLRMRVLRDPSVMPASQRHESPGQSRAVQSRRNQDWPMLPGEGVGGDHYVHGCWQMA